MSRLNSEVVLLYWDTPTAPDIKARKVAEFLGADVRLVSLTSVAASGASAMAKLVPSGACLIVDVETLARAADVMEGGANGLQVAIGPARHVFVYGFQATDRHHQTLRSLSRGGLLGVFGLDTAAAKFRVADGHRDWCDQFSGLSLGVTDPTRDGFFAEATGQGKHAVLIWANDKAFFVRVDHEECSLFFSACREMADLEEKVPSEGRLVPWFSRLVPLMMFLRGALGKRVWHNDQPRACFIIDDPLLRERYGFLQYRQLFETIRRERCSTSIAFIPWNYKRSAKDIADMIATKSGVSSLCIHGCDHTAAEFGTTDLALLYSKARLALVRMRAHRRRSAALFDEVMVFPQGIFSSEALKALKACGYLAAVNTDLCPSNMPADLALRDLLQVAITRFGDFPLFRRHYPKDPADFAFDLFLGKPALAVEHHGYFRNGYDALKTFVRTLNALEHRLEWSNLSTICSRACLTRMTESGEMRVRFYADRFFLRNGGTHQQKYVLLRRQCRQPSPPSLRVNRRQWEFEEDGDDLKITLWLDVGQTADVRLSASYDASILVSRPPPAGRPTKVFVRRLLSEFRDNYVDTSPALTRLVRCAQQFRSTVVARRGARG